MIYVVQILDGKYRKIGYCKDIKARIAQLQTGSPYEIVEHICVEGSLMQEKSLHAALNIAFHRIGIPTPPNEWYPGKHPFFEGVIDALKISPVQAIMFAESYNPNVKQWIEKKERSNFVSKWATK